MARQYRISTSIEFFGSKLTGRIFARERQRRSQKVSHFQRRNPRNEAARKAISARSGFASYFVGRSSIPGRFRNIIDLPVLPACLPHPKVPFYQLLFWGAAGICKMWLVLSWTLRQKKKLINKINLSSRVRAEKIVFVLKKIQNVHLQKTATSSDGRDGCLCKLPFSGPA